jgi:NTE family protein
MNGKDNVKKIGTNQGRAFQHVVSEGSVVVLNARDVIGDADTSSVKNYSWKPTDIHLDDGIKNNPVISFTAPYVKDDGPYTTLRLELTTTHQDSKIKDSTYDVDVIVKRIQRVMIFQGGVALGAYEAGVYRAIVDKLIKEDEDRRIKGLVEKRPLFDIVAGTSIGAMNAAIVVSSVINNDDKTLEDPKNWQESVQQVIKFWKIQEQFPTYADFLDMNPFYHYSRDLIHNASKVFKQSFTELMDVYSSNIDPNVKKWFENSGANWSFFEPSFLNDYITDGWYIPATAEASRRYYSASQFHRWSLGALNVASGILPWSAFGKFFDFSDTLNLIPRPDNKHYVLYSLKRTLEGFAKFPINTSPPTTHDFPKKPRLLLVTVDGKTGDAVTFDSYDKKAIYHDDENIISNDGGINIEHALASGTFPDFFDYPKFTVEMGKKNEEHIFWDGGFRSNTPLREVIQAHRDYWYKTRKEVHVPDLEVYIADLWPSELKENPISFDKDFVENRKWDLILGDKTDYDEQVASVVTDYVDLVRRLKNLAIQKGASNEVDDILNSRAISINTQGKTRRNRELIEGRFRLTKVVRVDLKDDENQINDKIFDYSYKTIEELMRTGYNDALIRMDMERLKDGVLDLAKRNGQIQGEHENDRIVDLEKNIYQIQEIMSVEQDGAMIKQVRDFMDTVQGMGEVLSGKEQASLIGAAKQLEDTITVAYQQK